VKIDTFLVPPGKDIDLREYDSEHTGDYQKKQEAVEKTQEYTMRLGELQEVLYAQNRHALLVIMQGMDASGKDSAIKHIMSGVNPQGTDVHSFKAPSSEELDHDYLWRVNRALPERGRIGIFNRSYYEEVLVVRVHPEILAAQQLPAETDFRKIWKQRFEQINNFERYLEENGIHVVKCFLNLSKKEQKKRFLARIDSPDKNWKFSAQDVKERGYWDDYMKAYEEVLSNTSTDVAPWYVVPADQKWFARLLISKIIVSRLESLGLEFPTVDDADKLALAAARESLLGEK
jgi:PPK2 family polyphosphate:nucleotide phosphotransferase